MERIIKVLIVQNNAILRDRAANYEKVIQMLKPYADKEYDLIVLPEVWAVGWLCPTFPEMAENFENNETLCFLSNMARLHNANVVGGSYIKKTADGKLYNCCPVFNREGNLITQYDKMHLFANYSNDEDKYITRGAKPVIAHTDIGKLGLTICYDIRFPELFRAYTFAGADILINVAAWPKTRPHHWINLQKARAIENQSFVIAVSQAGLIENDVYNFGHSMVISPFGDIIAELGEEEGILTAEINLAEMSELRKTVPTLKDRRIDDYKILEAQ